MKANEGVAGAKLYNGTEEKKTPKTKKKTQKPHHTPPTKIQ